MCPPHAEPVTARLERRMPKACTVKLWRTAPPTLPCAPIVTATTCILAPNEPQSSVNPGRVSAVTCGRCHGDERLDARYNLPADRVPTFRRQLSWLGRARRFADRRQLRLLPRRTQYLSIQRSAVHRQPRQFGSHLWRLPSRRGRAIRDRTDPYSAGIAQRGSRCAMHSPHVLGADPARSRVHVPPPTARFPQEILPQTAFHRSPGSCLPAEPTLSNRPLVDVDKFSRCWWSPASR